MKAIRFVFLSIYSGIKPEMGLPLEESQAMADAWIIPASYVINEPLISNELLVKMMSKAEAPIHGECGVALWSAQEKMVKLLKEKGWDVRGLPPLQGRAIQSFFMPSSTLWLGVYCPTDSIKKTQEELKKELSDYFKAPVKKLKSKSFPWLGEFSGSSAWALGANQVFLEELDQVPIKKERKKTKMDETDAL